MVATVLGADTTVAVAVEARHGGLGEEGEGFLEDLERVGSQLQGYRSFEWKKSMNMSWGQVVIKDLKRQISRKSSGKKTRAYERREAHHLPLRLWLLGFVAMLKYPNSNATKMERKIGTPNTRKVLIAV